MSDDYKLLLKKVRRALDGAVEIAISIDEIQPYPNQPRHYFNQESIQRLSDSILAGGQTTSGMVREINGKVRYELIDGERRFRAIGLIPKEVRPLYKAKLIEADDDVVQFLIAGMANFNREGHTGLEITETIDRFVSFGIPMKEIASLIGVSEFWAYQMYGLKKLVPTVSAMLDPKIPKNEQLPLTAAIQISKIPGEHQLGLAKRVLSKDISLQRLRGEVINVAKRESVKIRLRETSSAHTWASFKKKFEVAARLMSEAEALLSSKRVVPYLKGDVSAKEKIVQQAESIAKMAEELRTKIIR